MVCLLLSAQTHQKPEITMPNLSTVQVTDIFQKLVRHVQWKTWMQLHRIRSPLKSCTSAGWGEDVSCRAAGASVSVLCTCSLGTCKCDQPAEGREWPGSHTQRRLPCPGGWSGAWRLCSGEQLCNLFWSLSQKFNINVLLSPFAMSVNNTHQKSNCTCPFYSLIGYQVTPKTKVLVELCWCQTTQLIMNHECLYMARFPLTAHSFSATIISSTIKQCFQFFFTTCPKQALLIFNSWTVSPASIKSNNSVIFNLLRGAFH